MEEGSMIVEIRAAEGGDEAKDLVHEQARLYLKRARFHRL
jgi:protein subunit release factor A